MQPSSDPISREPPEAPRAETPEPTRAETSEPTRIEPAEERSNLNSRLIELEVVRRTLERERQRYAELFDFAPDAYLETDSHGVIENVNLTATTLLRTGRDALVGRSMAMFVDNAKLPVFHGLLDRLRHGEEIPSIELQVQPRDGAPYHAMLRVIVIRDPTPGPPRFRWSLSDVTRRKSVEESLRENETKLRAIVDSAPDGIITISEWGLIESCNPAADTIFGYAARELIGRGIAVLLAAPSRDAHDGRLMDYLNARDGEVFGQAQWLEGQRKDGSTFPIALAANEVPLGLRRIVTLIVRDVTELKQAQERALRAERLAALGEMATGLAHESRNALQQIQSYLELLTIEVGDLPKPRRFISQIQAAQDRLHRLLEDVRSYAAPIRLNPSECDLREIWREAWAQTSAQRSNRDTQLDEDAAGLNLFGYVDRFATERVFRNVLENAIAACADPARIAIRVADSSLAGRSALRIAVRDNGPGLTPEARRRIFEPFFTTKTHGTGLGMAIVHRIVAAHEGRISVSDDAAPGAEIVIELPRGNA